MTKRDELVLKVCCIMHEGTLRKYQTCKAHFDGYMNNAPWLTHYEVVCCVVDSVFYHGKANAREIRQMIDKICELV